MKNLLLPFTITLALTSAAFAEQPATQPVDAAAAAQVDALRDHLKAAYAKGDVPGMLKYLHPNVVIIFPDGEILHGRDALLAYYDKMLKSPDAIVESYTSDAVVKERYLHGDTVVSYGLMNDNYVLKDGTKFGLDSRFTVTVMREPDESPETGGWMIRSFHSSTDAFDNPVLVMVAKKSAWSSGAGGVMLGMVVGVALALIVRAWRNKRGAADDANPTTTASA